MDPFHERLASVALDVAGPEGAKVELGLAADHDPGFDKAWFAEALAAIDRLPDSLFQPCGMTPAGLSALRQRMHAWARKISSTQ